MKRHTVYLLISLCVHASATATWAGNSQQAHKKALLKSMRICERMQSGRYDVVYRRKYPFVEDIESVVGHCTFSKVAKDKILGARVFLESKGAAKEMIATYDGRYEVVMTSTPEPVARVADLSRCDAHFIATNSISGLLFKPLLPIPLFSDKQKSTLQYLIQKRSMRIEKLPDASIDGRPCHVFAVHCKDREEIKNEVLTIFIDAALHIPIKYVHRRIYWGSPTYEEAAIRNFTLNAQEDPNCVPDALADIPAGYKVTNVSEASWPHSQLLAINSAAPLWALPTVQGGTLSLQSLRGKVVLLSFWCQHCDASLQYLRSLQRLQEKLQNQGVVVVGINTHSKHGALASFLSQRGITYPNLLGSEQVTKDYHAYVPNTFYLLDHTGRVCYAATTRASFPGRLLQKKIQQLIERSRQISY